METLLKNIFHKDIVLNAIIRRKFMISLEKLIIDRTKLDIFLTWLEKRIGYLGKSQFTYYTRDAVSVLRKPLNLVAKTTFINTPEYEYTTPKTVHSGLGQQVYHPSVRDLI